MRQHWATGVQAQMQRRCVRSQNSDQRKVWKLLSQIGSNVMELYVVQLGGPARQHHRRRSHSLRVDIIYIVALIEEAESSPQPDPTPPPTPASTPRPDSSVNSKELWHGRPQHPRSRLRDHRRRHHRLGVCRHALEREHGHDDHRRPSRQTRRPLARCLSLCAPARCCRGVRRELAAARPGHGRRRRPQPGPERAGQRRRDLRVLRSPDAATPAAQRPGDLPEPA